MRFTTSFDREPGVGVAYSTYLPTLLREHPDAVDYVEVPFELLCHNPSVIEVAALKPVVLHCASMSMAGTVLPREETITAIQAWIERTHSPWLGEHLAFIMAEHEKAGPFAEEYAPGEPYNIGYTVVPPMNEETMRLVLRSMALCEERFSVPTLLENPPVYFLPPGTTMSQVEFLSALCERSTTHLLLDLTHFYITSRTLGFDARREIVKLPLDRVVEIHVSGIDEQEGIHWDNHASRAPKVIFDLLAIVLAHSEAKAITLEYNWSSRFPLSVLLEEIAGARAVIAQAHAQSA